MKITELKTHLYEFENNRVVGDANSPAGRKLQSNLLIEVKTDEGLTGYSSAGASAKPLVESMFNRALKDKDPSNVKGITKQMMDFAFKGGHGGMINEAISALDIALWDLKAKSNNEPLWKTLGGLNPKVRAYASGLDIPMNDKNLKEWYEKMASWGFDGGKLKVGLNQDDDIRRIGIMRDALKVNSDNPLIMIDSNEYWSPKQAIRFISEIEQTFDLTWAEEPARRWDFIGLKKVSDGIKTAVCAGENLKTMGDFLPYFQYKSADVIQVSSGMGGVTTAMQLADAAYGFELPVTLGGSFGHVHAHMATAIPNFMIMEITQEEPDPCMTWDVTFENGHAIPGNKPGIGVEINYDILEKIKVEKTSPSTQSSPFGRRPGAGLYQVSPSKEAVAALNDVSFAKPPLNNPDVTVCLSTSDISFCLNAL